MSTWHCPCGAEASSALPVCPVCAYRQPAQDVPPTERAPQPKFSVTCPACGHQDTAEVALEAAIFRCTECRERIAYGEVVGDWVLEPSECGKLLRLRVTKGKEVRHYVLDPLFALHVAYELQSIGLPDL